MENQLPLTGEGGTDTVIDLSQGPSTRKNTCAITNQLRMFGMIVEGKKNVGAGGEE